MFDQMKLVTASGDHTSKLFDIGQGEIRSERVFCGHTRSVKTVAFRKDDSSSFATGGRDGNIVLWDMRTNCRSYVGSADRTISNSHTAKTFTPSKSRRKFSTPTQGIKSVTGLVFQENNTLISCGAGDGVIKIWDLRKNYNTYKKEAAPRSTIPYPGNTTRNGYSSLIMDNQGIKLYANCLDNTIYCFNVGTHNTEPFMYYRGHQNNTFYIKSSLTKDGSYLISGSSDENAYIWNTKFSQPIAKLVGHSAEVTCVAFCDKNSVLITCSDDMTHKIWSVGCEALPDDWEVIGRGSTEILPLDNTAGNVKFKRSIPSDHYNTPKRFFVECDRCSKPSNSKLCDACANTSKRKSSCEFERENKMQLTEFGPRKLFSKFDKIEETDNLATIDELEYNPPEKLSRIENISEECSEKDDYKPAVPRSEIVSSLTVNLPNFIVDGIAPHINYSPPKRKSYDWLTKLRIENQLKREMYDKTEGMNAPKMPKLEPNRTKKHGVVQRPLLNYFKVTNSAPKCEAVSPKIQECDIVRH